MFLARASRFAFAARTPLCGASTLRPFSAAHKPGHGDTEHAHAEGQTHSTVYSQHPAVPESGLSATSPEAKESGLSATFEVSSPDADSAPPHAYASIDDLVKLQLTIGRILQAESVPKSKKLYKLSVSIGNDSEPRTILTGVRQHFAPEDLVGKLGVFALNLEPRAMAGTTSHGMMLFAEDAQTKELVMLTVHSPVAAGSPVS